MKTMKNILLIMLAGVAMMMSSCSKDSPVDPVTPVNPPAPADRWEDVLTCNIDQVFPNYAGGPFVRLFLVIAGAERNYVPQFPVVHVQSQGEQLFLVGPDEKPCVQRDVNWYDGDGIDPHALAKYVVIPLLLKVGIFDFTLEVPAENPVASKSYRTKLLRLKMDKSPAGEWSAEFLPVDGQ